MGYKNSDIKVYGRFWSETTDSKIVDASQIDGFNLENGTGTGSLVQKTVSSSGTPYANEAIGSGAVGLGKKIKSNGNATFVTGQENEAIAGTSASVTSGYLNVNRGSYNITGGENNANNNSWNLVIGKNNAVSDGRFGIISGLDNVYTGRGSTYNTSVSMLGNNLYVQADSPSDGALLIGRYNRVQNNPGRLFIVGNGTSPNDRKNAFEVLEDGRAKIQTTPQDTDDVTNKGYVDTADSALDASINIERNARRGEINALIGNGMDGTGNPPLQGYNKNKGTIENRLAKLVYKTKDLGSISEAKQYLRYPHSFVYYANYSGGYSTYDCFYSNGSFYFISSGSIQKVTESFSINNYVRVIYVDLAGI